MALRMLGCSALQRFYAENSIAEGVRCFRPGASRRQAPRSSGQRLQRTAGAAGALLKEMLHDSAAFVLLARASFYPRRDVDYVMQAACVVRTHVPLITSLSVGAASSVWEEYKSPAPNPPKLPGFSDEDSLDSLGF